MGRGRDVLRKEVNMAVGFGSVAGGTRAAPVEHVTGEVRPNIAGGDDVASGAATRVGKVVEVLENEVAEWPGNQWSGDSSGDVAVELVASDRVRRNGEGVGSAKVAEYLGRSVDAVPGREWKIQEEEKRGQRWPPAVAVAERNPVVGKDCWQLCWWSHGEESKG